MTLDDLSSALDQASKEQDANTDIITQDVLLAISEQLNAAGLSLDSGELLYQSLISDLTVEEGCNRTVILQMQTDVAVQQSSALSLDLQSLYEPVVVELDLLASVEATGTARQILGIRLGDCRNLARDTFAINAVGPLALKLTVSLELNPEWTDESVLSLFPTIEIDGSIDQFDPAINVSDTVLKSLLKDLLEDEVRSAFSTANIKQRLVDVQADIDLALDEALDDGRIDIELPPSDDEQILNLYKLLQPDARFPITLEMIQQHRQQILASAVLGDSRATGANISDALICQAGSAFMGPLKHIPIYSGDIGACSAVELANDSPSPLHDTDQCANSFSYIETSIAEYCDTALDKQRLGNPQSRPQALNQWSLSPGTRFDIMLRSNAELIQPFMWRESYRQISTARGECELEMRVYSTNPNAEDQKALLALHGGSWQHRASGSIGIEATATHFANEGFVVFAPFYRLIGESDGNTECNLSTLSDILDDSNAALDWVQQHQSRFGASGLVTLFGQSAGGHLALSLSVNRPEEIRRSVLFYTPSDFAEFASEIQSGTYDNPVGSKILELVAGESIESLNIESALVQENSFHSKIAANPEAIPPLFILHGQMDSLLPYRQSVGLCNALSGAVSLDEGPASSIPNLTDYVSRTQCSESGSELHLIAEGEHALDLCLSPGLCLAGSEQSAMAAGESIESMLDWVAAASVDRRIAFDDNSANDGGVFGVGKIDTFSLWLFAVLLLNLKVKAIKPFLNRTIGQ